MGIAAAVIVTAAATTAVAATGASDDGTTVADGVFVLDKSSALTGPVNVTGGILRGSGSIGALTADGGRIEPGIGPGILTTQSLTLGAGSMLALELNGPIGEASHDVVQRATCRDVHA